MRIKSSEVYRKNDGLYSLGEGLYLRVSNQGKRRVWVARGTTRQNSSYLTLGSVDALSYREARRKLSESSRIDEKGIPMFYLAYEEALEELAFKKQYKVAKTIPTFKSLIQTYLLPSLKLKKLRNGRDQISSGTG